MKGISILLATMAATALVVSVAFANPGMLPAHPGYPAKGKSPATGQSTANDSGQTAATGMKVLTQSATSQDAASTNSVSDPNRARIKKSAGAGQLPVVDSMNRVDVNPAGATSTK